MTRWTSRSASRAALRWAPVALGVAALTVALLVVAPMKRSLSHWRTAQAEKAAGVAVELSPPQASQVAAAADGQLVIDIARDGTLRCGGAPVAEADLPALLAAARAQRPSLAVLVRMDPQVETGLLLRVIEQARGAGAAAIALATGRGE